MKKNDNDFKSRSRSPSQGSNKGRNESTSNQSLGRIIISNIPTDVIGQTQLSEIFKPYGEITGISVHKNFAFLQFKHDVSARRAASLENNRIVAGRKMDVRHAGEIEDRNSSPGRRYSDARPEPLPPPPHRGGPRDVIDVDAIKPDRPSSASMSKLDMSSIVIVRERHDPRLIGYAEMIKSRLQKLGLNSSVVFLDPPFDNDLAIEQATRDGMLYAAIVSVENEMHLSLTLYILHGHAQEHRNMPLTDALKLVATNFDEYLRKLKEEVDPDSSKTSDPVADIDPAISLIMLNLAEGKPTSLKQLHTALDYILQIRDQLNDTKNAKRIKSMIEKMDKNGGELVDVTPPQEGVKTEAKQQADDLQAKIKKLFGDTHKQLNTVGLVQQSSNSESSVKKEPKKPQQSPLVDLTNPAFQNALKNLIKSSPKILDAVRRNSSPEKETRPQSKWDRPPHTIERPPHSSERLPYGNERQSNNSERSERSSEHTSGGNKIPTIDSSRSAPSSYKQRGRDEYVGRDEYIDGREHDEYMERDKYGDRKRESRDRPPHDDYERERRRYDDDDEYSTKHKRAKPGRPTIAGFY